MSNKSARMSTQLRLVLLRELTLISGLRPTGRLPERLIRTRVYQRLIRTPVWSTSYD